MAGIDIVYYILYNNIIKCLEDVMRKEFFSRNIFNKYLIGGVLVILAAFAVLFSMLIDSNVNSNVAHADDELPDKPTVEIKYAIKSYTENGDIARDEYNNPILSDLSSGSFVIDAYEKDWEKRILNELVIWVDFKDYMTTQTKTFYTAGANSTLCSMGTNPNPRVTSITQSAIKDRYLLYVDAYSDDNTYENSFLFTNGVASTQNEYLIVKDITLNGKTWYGAEITKSLSKVKADGGSIPAGNYSITSVDVEYKLDPKYISEIKIDVYYYNTSSQEGQEQAPKPISPTPTYYIESTTGATATYMYAMETGSPAYVALKSHVSVNLGDASDQNLYIDAIYDPEIQWADHVKLMETETIGDKNKYYFFSYTDDTRKTFRVKYGFAEDKIPDDGTTKQIDLNGDFGGIKYYQAFELNWYDNESLEVPSEETISAQSYYLEIKVSTSLEGYNTLLTPTGEIKLMEVMDDTNTTEKFVFEFVVGKKQLRVDIANEYGAKVIDNAVSYTTSYMLYQVPQEFIGKKVQLISEEVGLKFYTTPDSGETYEEVPGTAEFVDNVGYYVGVPSAVNLFGSTDIDDVVWAKMQGYPQDLDRYYGTLLSFSGSHFEASDVGEYDSIIVFAQLEDSFFYTNYSFEFGTFAGDVWTSFSNNTSSSGKSYLMDTYHANITNAEIRKYKFYGEFKILPPIVELDFGNFTDNGDYGEVRDNNDIDYSGVKVTNAVDFITGKGGYNVVTSEDNWYIKIVSDRSDIKTSLTDNILYVYLLVANINNNPTSAGFDLENIAYEPYNGVLFAGNYYVIYEGHLALAGETATVQLEVDDGVCAVSNALGTVMFSVSMERIAYYNVNKVSIYMEIEDFVAEKVYDGTNVVWASDGTPAKVSLKIGSYDLASSISTQGYSNILDYDLANYINYTQALLYSTKIASANEIDINAVVTLKAIDGYQGSNDVINSIMNSYELSSKPYYQGRQEQIKGKINYRYLTIEILENPDKITDISDPNFSTADYSRNFGEDTYVAFRVARYNDLNSEGVQIKENYGMAAYYATQFNMTIDEFWENYAYYADYYYYYDESTGLEEYYFYSELPEIWNERCYIFLTLENTNEPGKGLLPTESFEWDITREYENEDIFNYNPNIYMKEPFMAKNLIYWFDMHTGVPIDKETQSNNGNYYELTLDIDNFSITNYKIEPSNRKFTFSFEVRKIILNPEDVFELRGNNISLDRYLAFDGNSKLDKIFTDNDETTFVSLRKHPEFEAINALYSGQFKDFLSVAGFAINYYSDESLNKEFSEEELANGMISSVIWAGTYTFKITVPATSNYRSVVGYHTVTVDAARVDVYTTVAKRTYMPEYDFNKEVKLSTVDSAVKLNESELELRKRYINSNTGEIFNENVNGVCDVIYVYFENNDVSKPISTDFIHVYYVGFMGTDTFDGEIGEMEATFTFNSPFASDTNGVIDSAGKYTKVNNSDANVISVTGAYMRNYVFSYRSASLYVIKQNLELEITPNQELTYTGEYIMPDYEIYNDNGDPIEGSLEIYIAGYYDSDGNIYIKDYTGVSPFIRKANVASDYNALNDYYFYFFNGGKEIFVYNDGANYFYYANNDTTNAKTYISSFIPNFAIQYGEGYAGYVAILPGIGDDGKIYLVVNEQIEAANNDRQIKNVFYIDGKPGGYVLKTYAMPPKGGDSSNYERSAISQIFVNVAMLSIELKDSNSETIDGTIVNPIAFDTYSASEFVFKYINSYYKGTTIRGEEVEPEYYWGKVEYAILDDNRQIYYYWDSGNFEETYASLFAAYETDYTTTNFNKADINTTVTNAGVYVILAKVTISDGTQFENQTEDMTKNIRFANTSSQSKFGGEIIHSQNDSEAYFVLYLVMNRSNEVTFNASPSVGLQFIDTDYDGIADTYTKTYDAKGISMGAQLSVLGKESSKGEILNIRAYMSPTENERDGEYYFISNYSYELDTNVEIGEDVPKNTYYEKFGLDYRLTDDTVFAAGIQYYTKSHYIDDYQVSKVSLVNHNEFYVIYLVNYNDNKTYDNNYTTIKKTYKISITQRALDVSFELKEGEESFKYFGEKNSDIESKFYFSYQNWANDTDRELLERDISSPVVDWRNVMTEDDPEGEYMSCKEEKYLIYAKDAPNAGTYVPAILVDDKSYSNYTFNYNTASIGFEIRKLQLVVGGSEYPRVEIDEYVEYQGVGMEPRVLRYGHDGRDLDNPSNGLEDKITTQVTLEGKFNDGAYDYQREYTETELLNLPKTKVGSALGVGYYLFKISMPDSTNYKGIGTIYWVFEITKSMLVVEFIDEYKQAYRGREEKVYSGDGVVYPNYNIKYTGFLGADAITYPEGIEEQISFLHYSNGQHEVVNNALGLINPYYVFIDENTGNELRDTDGNPIMPTERGTYYLKVIYDRSSNGYGYANNYDILIEYANEGGDTLYPEFVITARKVTVRYDSTQNTKIVKTYDGTYEVKEGSVTYDNYVFTKVTGAVESGLIDGDEIYISVNYLESMYARKTVYDSLGVMSDIEVYLLVDSTLVGPDYNNYELVIIPTEDNAHVAGGVTYLKLCGMINPASATVRFYKDGQVMTNRITEVYDGLPKPVTVVVTGVNGEMLTLEGGGYTMKYVSELSNYDREEAPSNCDTYVVTVVITDTNYIPTSNSIDLVVGQAEVEINFGGDGIQIYGDVTIGLSATAISVNSYRKDLTVSYYYYNEDGTQGALIEDISKAPVGTYIVEAIHNETTNYGYKRDTELLTIVRREVHLNYDVANHYKYTGQPVDILMYFIDATTTYYPQLMFDSIVDGQATPYNYTISDNGMVTSIINQYPVDAGQYRVKACEEFGNYHISDAIWCDFDIQKADMVVSVADAIIDEGDTIKFTIVLVGNLTSASANSILSGVQYKYYDAISGVEISGEPTVAGEYKVICYGATAKNYNLSYSFGILKINKVTLETTVQGSNSKDEQKQILMEGSFNSNMSIAVNKKQNSEYVDMVTTYQSYVANNPDFGVYKLSDVYVFEYVNYVPSAIRGNVVVKLHSKDIIKLIKESQKNDETTGGDANEQLKFNIALLDANGNFTIVEGYQEGDYVCFETTETQIKAISILMNENIVVSDAMDWLLYVGIAVAVLLIGIAIVIVVKRA